jgi:hypothetical protein
MLNQDNSWNNADNAAPAGFMLLGTGEGQTTPAGVDGQVASSVFPKPVLPVSYDDRRCVPGCERYPVLRPRAFIGIEYVRAQPPDLTTGPLTLAQLDGDCDRVDGAVLVLAGWREPAFQTAAS